MEQMDSAAARSKVVVGSGWWSAPERSRWNIGDDRTRSTEFFALWHRQVIKAFDPSIILVTDSCSPQKPDWQRFERVKWLELDRNYGHANDIRVGLSETKYSGFTRSVLMGAAFAICCDADYFVYVEQDCLVRGENFLQVATGGQAFDFFCGETTTGGRAFNGGMAAPMPQRSLQIATRIGMRKLVSALLSAPETDGELPGEVKMARDMAPLGLVSAPYGRSRPIDFSLSHFYAQHMTLDELRAFLRAENLDFGDWFTA